MGKLECTFIASITYSKNKTSLSFEDNKESVGFYSESNDLLKKDIRQLVEKLKTWIKNHDQRRVINFKIVNFQSLEIYSNGKSSELKTGFSEDEMLLVWKYLND